MTVALSPVYGAGAQFFDDNGDPLAGGYLYTFLAGTTTPATTYTSSSGLVANTNPIVLDAAGRPMDDKEIWLTVGTAYKFVLKSSTFVEIWTQDNITIWTPTDLTASLANSTNVALGDAMVAFKQSNSSGVLSGAVAKTVHDKLQEFVSVKDFGAVGDGVTPDGDAIVAACASGRQVYFPAGTYLLDAPIEIGGIDGLEWRGAGQGITTIKTASGTWTAIGILFEACNFLRITGITFDQSLTTYDDGGELFAGMQIAGRDADSADICVDHCDFLDSYFIGLSLWRTVRFEISECLFSRRSSALNGARHYCINASCLYPDGSGSYLQTGTILQDGLIHGNKLYSSGMSVAGWNIRISNNQCQTTDYGACIATYDRPVATASLDPAWVLGLYTVTGNTCSGGQGVDADSYETAGIEVGGPYSVCANNISYNNAGQGIRWFSYQGVCIGNICYNNGTAGGTSWGTYTQAGITAYLTVASPVRTHYSARYSLIANNICFDTGGGDQLYGYSENTAAPDYLIGMNVIGNKVTENATGTGYLINSAANNSYDFDQWDTYVPSFGSGGGTLGTVTSPTGRYSRRGGVVFFNIYANIAIGSATGYLTVTLPTKTINDTALSVVSFSGMDATTNKALIGYTADNSVTAKVFLYTGAFPFSGTADIVLTGHYTASAVG